MAALHRGTHESISALALSQYQWIHAHFLRKFTLQVPLKNMINKVTFTTLNIQFQLLLRSLQSFSTYNSIV